MIHKKAGDRVQTNQRYAMVFARLHRAGELTAVLGTKDISIKTYIMVPDICRLARATRALSLPHHRKLYEYSGEAMSYLVLEQLASLGIGAVILPKSKLSA